jgi:DNA adenine methylase
VYVLNNRRWQLNKKYKIIYADPPYAKTTGYKDKFDHEQFWKWCREKKAEGHAIFVSEYDAPADFICVWDKQVNSSLTKNTGAKKAVEKLFTL